MPLTNTAIKALKPAWPELIQDCRVLRVYSRSLTISFAGAFKAIFKTRHDLLLQCSNPAGPMLTCIALYVVDGN